MKRSLTFVCILASGFGASALAQASSAAAPSAMPSAPVPASTTPAAPVGPAKIAIIQFQQAVAATNEGQRDFAELRKKFEPKQTQLKSLSDEIDGLKKQLQSPTATEASKATLTRQIDEKTKSLQRQGEDAQNDFQTETGETYQKLAEKVYQIVQAYAAQSGYTLVLDASAQQSPVLWANQGTDISQAVVEAYNQKSGIPAPAGAAAGAGSTTPRSTAPTRSPTPKPSTTTPQ